MHDERRDMKERKQIAHVDLDVPSNVRSCCTGADTEPKDTGENTALLLTRARIHHPEKLVSEGGIAPTTLKVVRLSFGFFPGGKPREARAPYETGRRIHQDQSRSALGIGGGKQHRQRGSIAEPEEHRTLRSDRVQDRPDVVHTRLKRWETSVSVGHAGSALVDS